MSSKIYPYISNKREVALSLSASELGAKSMTFQKDPSGKPIPYFDKEKYFWSLSDNVFENETVFVGVVHTEPIGIDFEFMRERSYMLYEQNNTKNMLDFYRLWTAKEATFKAWNGKLRPDSDIEVKLDENPVIVHCGTEVFRIAHFYFGTFMAAISCKSEVEPVWRMSYACSNS